MAATRLRLLGIGSVEITAGERRVLIDAFNDKIAPPDIRDGDVLLFTHADGDHFDPDALSSAFGTAPERGRVPVVGPPGIAAPLLTRGIVDPEDLAIVYPTEYEVPVRIEPAEGVAVTVYNTDHFIGWRALHVSFLMEIGGKRIYVTGDAAIRGENLGDLKDLDCLVLSLLHEDSVKGHSEARFARYYNFCDLLDARRRLAPKLLVANHLLHCPWAANAAGLAALAAAEGVDGVRIPLSDREILNLP